jgi:hypothetical protein
MRTQLQIENMYAAREAAVSRLATQDRISASDVSGLCRHGQFQVAANHWSLCDAGARSVLLNAHPHVASTARISDRGE